MKQFKCQPEVLRVSHFGDINERLGNYVWKRGRLNIDVIGLRTEKMRRGMDSARKEQMQKR